MRKDIEQIVKELLKTIRGKDTQIALSQKLGYKTNHVYKWEAGSATITWLDFVKLCDVSEVALKQALKAALFATCEPNNYSEICTMLINNKTQNEIAETLNVSRFAVGRWIKKQNPPSLAEVLTLMSLRIDVLEHFLDILVGLNNIPSMKLKAELEIKQREVHYKFPISGLLLGYLDFSEYLATDLPTETFLASKLGISPADVRANLNALVDAKMIEVSENKYKILSHFMNTRGNFDSEKNIRVFYSNLANEYLKNQKQVMPRTLSAYNSFTISNAGFEKIKKKYYDFFKDIQKIIIEDTPNDNELMAVLNLQIFDYKEAIESKKNI